MDSVPEQHDIDDEEAGILNHPQPDQQHVYTYNNRQDLQRNFQATMYNSIPVAIAISYILNAGILGSSPMAIASTFIPLAVSLRNLINHIDHEFGSTETTQARLINTFDPNQQRFYLFSSKQHLYRQHLAEGALSLAGILGFSIFIMAELEQLNAEERSLGTSVLSSIGILITGLSVWQLSRLEREDHYAQRWRPPAP